MEILIIVGLIMLMIGVICLFMDAANGLAFCLGVMGAYILSGGIMMYQESCIPKAMDVYQGKTTLEYTIRDGMTVDSVVVFKDKER